ncbi:MAG: class I SAM-dependent methyltransferase [Candidatus Poribacteria bacterium]|nr:class I SAM-dependent methyltransferase [Candidatus Poribacteria bacterium]
MSRSDKVLTDNQDAYGQLLSDYHDGRENVEIVEREDGFIDTSRLGPRDYFAAYKDWAEHQRLAMEHAAGRVLDIGCGAGRHCLYLQKRGHDVLGTDISPLAIQTCQRRGIKNTLVTPVTQLSSKIGVFDTILMMGHNFGLTGSYKRAKWLLGRFAAMTTDTAKIIAETLDPYQTQEPCHLAYHQFNRDRGRMAGQLRLRIRYRQYMTPWFDYLFVSKVEMEDILNGTAWRAERYIDSANTPTYVAILMKRSRS